MQMLSTVAVLSAAFVAVSAARPVEGAGYGPKVGERHPDFTLPNIRTGQPISLSDFRGKKLLLVQFASW